MQNVFSQAKWLELQSEEQNRFERNQGKHTHSRGPRRCGRRCDGNCSRSRRRRSSFGDASAVVGAVTVTTEFRVVAG